MNVTQKDTHVVCSSSKFHNHSLVSGGLWPPSGSTPSPSLLNDTRSHSHEHSRCSASSLQTVLSVASLLRVWPVPFFPTHCFRLVLSVSTVVRLLIQECGEHFGTLFYKAKQRIQDVKCGLFLLEGNQRGLDVIALYQIYNWTKKL